MDIVKLADRLKDIKLGEVANGQLVSFINEKLPEDKKIYSDTSGEQLKEIYLALPVATQKELDKALTVETNPELYATFLEDLNYLSSQRQINKAGAQSTRRRFMVLILLIVILINFFAVFSYHSKAGKLLGTHYESDILHFVLDSVEKVGHVFGIDIGADAE